MPGDALIAEPLGGVTHAITIDAPPEAVWPWLAQMGAGRAGWYSWDALDNGGAPSATEIVAGLQQLAPGDVLPALPGVEDCFVVEAVRPPAELVLSIPRDAEPRATWTFELRRAGDKTRLVVRARLAAGWLAADDAPPRRLVERFYAALERLPAPLVLPIAVVGHRVMQARQLRGIKRRAEALLSRSSR